MLIATKTQTQIKTMSSKQIADVVGSRHDHVKRSIERLAEKSVIQLPPLEEVKNHLGQTVQEYQVNERDSYVVVAQLCPEYTAKLVDWWMATKNQQPVVALPTTYLDALKALVQTEEEKQLAIAQAAHLENQVNQLTPKARALDVIANSMGQKTITNVAKVLGVQPEKFLRPWMLKHHWIYLGRDGQYHAHAARIKDGHLVEKTRPIPRTSGITELKVTVYVTAQGETLLARRLAGEAA